MCSVHTQSIFACSYVLCHQTQKGRFPYLTGFQAVLVLSIYAQSSWRHSRESNTFVTPIKNKTVRSPVFLFHLYSRFLPPLGCGIKQKKTWSSSPNFLFSYQTETSHWKVTKSKATCTIAPNSVFSKAIKHPQPKSPHDVGLCPSETGPILEIWAYLAQLESRYIKQPKAETDPLKRGAWGLILLLIPSFSLFASIYTVYPKRLEII